MRAIPATPNERGLLADAALQAQIAQRTLAAVFSMFCASHDLPEGTRFASVEGDTVMVLDVGTPPTLVP